MKRFFKRFSSMILVVILAFTLLPLAVSATTETDAAEKATALEKKVYCTASTEDDFSTNEILVVMKRSVSEINKKLSTANFKGISITSIKDLTAVDSSKVDVKSYLSKVDFHQILKLTINSKSKEDLLSAIKILEKSDDVLSAEPNYCYNSGSAYLSAGTNDPVSQWGLDNINAAGAWTKYTANAQAVTVGVIDSGIASHEDLNANVISGYDFFNNNTITNDDTVVHGTHVAGIIGAVGNNSKGISGIAHTIKIAPLQVHDTIVNDASKEGIVSAIIYATMFNIPIVNISIGFPYSSTAENICMNNYPGLIVCAAGNTGLSLESYPLYPAAYDCENIISVAAIDSSNNLASFSTYSGSSVDIGAPGVAINSTVLNNGYTPSNGTSMASPHVAGVAALIKSNYPQVTTQEIKTAILSSATYTSSLNGKVITNGRLNALGALNYFDDYGDTFEDAYHFGFGPFGTVPIHGIEPIGGNLDVAKDVDMYALHNYLAGEHTIFSSDITTDVKAWLYDSAGNLLASNDDGGGNMNFKITYNFSANGTYYLKVSHWNQNGSGKYKLNILPDDYGNTADKAYPLTYNSNGIECFINYINDVDMFSFKPVTSGSYTFSGSGYGTYMRVTLSLGSQELATVTSQHNNNIGRYHNLTYNLVAGQTYYIKVVSMNPDEVGYYNMRVA